MPSSVGQISKGFASCNFLTSRPASRLPPTASKYTRLKHLARAAAVSFPPTSSLRLSNVPSVLVLCFCSFSSQPRAESPESDCAPPKFPLVSFVYGDQAVSVAEANAWLSCLRSAPHPQNAELSARTAETLVSSKTKPRSLGRHGLCPPFPCLDDLVLAQFFFFSFLKSLILRPLALRHPRRSELFNKSAVDFVVWCRPSDCATRRGFWI